MTTHNPAVTLHTPFCMAEELPLFCVNAGVPVEDALEQADTLLACINHFVACDAATNKGLANATLQYLSEMANAVVAACRIKEAAQA